MDVIKKNWKIIALVLLALFIWYQYNLYQKELEEKKKQEETGENGETCTKISYQDYQQKKADWYWKGRNLDQQAINTIVAKYKKTADGCDYRDSIWRWADDKVKEEGFCEASIDDVL